jgi:signal peptidase II
MTFEARAIRTRAFRHVLLVALTLLGAAGCDQGTKQWARRALASGPREFFEGRLQLILATNRGAFLSLGAGLPERVRTAVFTLCVAALSMAGVVWLLRHRRRSAIETMAMSLVVGGGIGNVLDRMLRAGAVTDFIFVRIGPLHTGIFNVADVCVTAGALMLVAWELGRKPH